MEVKTEDDLSDTEQKVVTLICHESPVGIKEETVSHKIKMYKNMQTVLIIQRKIYFVLWFTQTAKIFYNENFHIYGNYYKPHSLALWMEPGNEDSEPLGITLV